MAEEPAGFGEAASVIRFECGVNQVGDPHVFADRFRQQLRKLFIQRAHGRPGT